MFRPTKNEKPFLSLLQIYEEIFIEKYPNRGTAVPLQEPIMLVPKHITFLTH